MSGATTMVDFDAEVDCILTADGKTLCKIRSKHNDTAEMAVNNTVVMGLTCNVNSEDGTKGRMTCQMNAKGSKENIERLTLRMKRFLSDGGKNRQSPFQVLGAMEEMERTLSEAETELQASRNEAAAARSKAEMLQTKLDSATVALNAARSNEDNLRMELAELEGTIERRMNEIRSTEAQQAEAIKAQLERQKELDRMTIQTAQEECKDQMVKMMQDIERLKSEMEQYDQAAKTANARAEQMAALKEQTEAELASLQQAQTDALAMQRNTLVTEWTQKLQELDTARQAQVAEAEEKSVSAQQEALTKTQEANTLIAEAESKVAAAEDRVREMNEQIILQARRAEERHAATVAQLQAEAQAQMAALETESVNLRTEVAEADARISLLEAESKRIRAQIADNAALAEQEQKAHEQKLAEAEARIEAKNQEIADLKSASAANASALQVALDTNSQRLEAAQAEAIALKEAYDQLRVDVNKIVEDANVEAKEQADKAADFEAQLHEAERRIAELVDIKHQLEKYGNRIKAELDEHIEAAAVAHAKDIEMMERQKQIDMDALKELQRVSASRAQQLQNMLDSTEEALKASRRMVADLESKLAYSDQVILELENKVSSLQTRQAEIEKRYQTVIEGLRSEMDTMILQHKQHIEHLGTEHAKNLRDLNDQHERRVRAEQQQAERHKREAEEHYGAKLEAERVAELEKRRHDETKSDHTEELESLRMNHERRLKDVVAQYVSNLEIASSQASRHEQRAKELESTVAEAKSAESVHRSRANTLESQLAELRTSSSREQQDKAAQIRELQDELALARRQAAKEMQRRNIVVRIMNSIHSKQSSLEGTLRGFEASLGADDEMQGREIIASADRLREEYARLEDEKKKVEETAERAVRELEETRSKLKRAESQIAELNSQLRVATRRYEEHEKTVTKIQNEIQIILGALREGDAGEVDEESGTDNLSRLAVRVQMLVESEKRKRSEMELMRKQMYKIKSQLSHEQAMNSASRMSWISDGP